MKIHSTAIYMGTHNIKHIIKKQKRKINKKYLCNIFADENKNYLYNIPNR